MLKHELEYLAEPVRVTFLYDFPFLDAKRDDEKDINRYLAFILAKKKIVELVSEGINSLYKEITKQFNRESITASKLKAEDLTSKIDNSTHYKNFQISDCDKYFSVMVKYYKYLTDLEDMNQKLALDDINRRLYSMIVKRALYVARLITIRDNDIVNDLKGKMVAEEIDFYESIKKGFDTLFNTLYYNVESEDDNRSDPIQNTAVPKIDPKKVFCVRDGRMNYNFMLSDNTIISTMPVTLFRFDNKKEQFYIRCKDTDEPVYLTYDEAYEYFSWHIGIMGHHIQSVEISDEYKKKTLKDSGNAPKYFS